jgi:hypothetical protein
MKEKDIPLAIKKAASLMGQLGGSKMSEKKLAALRKNAKKGGRRPGVPLVRKSKKDRHRLLNTLTDNPEAFKGAAILMGMLGGSSRSELKVAASRLNAKKGGAPRKYQFTKKTRAILVIRNNKLSCIIPDSVAANLKEFKDKTFAAYHEDRRYNVRVTSHGADGIYLKRV